MGSCDQGPPPRAGAAPHDYIDHVTGLVGYDAIVQGRVVVDWTCEDWAVQLTGRAMVDLPPWGSIKRRHRTFSQGPFCRGHFGAE